MTARSPAQSPDWRPLAPTSRTLQELVFDSTRGRILMFGAASVTSIGETWEWHGSAWTLLTRSGPAARFATAMVYDSARDRVVLFGGEVSGGRSRQTWEW